MLPKNIPSQIRGISKYPYDPRTQDFEDKSHFSFDGHLLFERLEVQKYLPFEKQIKEMIFSILRSILVRKPPLQYVFACL